MTKCSICGHPKDWHITDEDGNMVACPIKSTSKNPVYLKLVKK